jgi:hypothetical protein
VRLTFGRVLNEDGAEIDGVHAGRPVILEFGYENHAQVDNLEMNATIFDHLGVAITNLHANLTNGQLRNVGARGVARCILPRLPLLPGSYRVAAAVNANGGTADLVANALRLEVVDSEFFPTGRVPNRQYSVCMFDHSWAGEAVSSDSRSAVNGTPKD